MGGEGITDLVLLNTLESTLNAAHPIATDTLGMEN